MSDYRLHLRNGTTYEGDDERETEDFAAAIGQSDMDDLPDGWTWLAGLYVRGSEVIAFEVLA